ncbi:butyrophilin subfamily 3 member A2-like isoform X1 [Micropterus salmoides]|uniref:butyrophilin subfamily 3 member A2-like isoform X1 n=1 Tax=Micropterus salmoides TaxID=27706 RepID=UPI0018EC0777|nr:butyrophilin subfamily 3 member A2-like isoform X1 [Micropterus salmoides]
MLVSRRKNSITVYVLMMHYRLFLFFLLTCCAGESSAPGSPEPVLAFVNGDVILPCSFRFNPSNDFPTVEWSKKGLQPDVIFLYRDGCETYEMKNPAFEYRTSLIMKELKNGNISLRISNVQLSDAGTYRCMRLWQNAPWETTTVELTVVSEQKPSVSSAEHTGVTIRCDCWLPESEITFVDDQGNNIPAEAPKRDQDARGCYTVTQRVTLQHPTNRVTCIVHQPEINQTRDTQILIPDDYVRSCSLMTAIAVGEAILLLSATLCGLAVMLWKRCGRSVEGKKQSSGHSTFTGTPGNEPLLSVGADNVANSSIERLTRELDDLKSKLHEREETIRQLQRKLKSHPCSVICQLEQPTIVCSPAASADCSPPISDSLPQNQGPTPSISRPNSNPQTARPISGKRHNNCSPAVLDFGIPASYGSFSANTSKTKLSRSISEPSAQPRPNHPKLQRRHSLTLPSPTLHRNRFTPLEGLTEESEPLISSKKSTHQLKSSK